MDNKAVCSLQREYRNVAVISVHFSGVLKAMHTDPALFLYIPLQGTQSFAIYLATNYV